MRSTEDLRIELRWAVTAVEEALKVKLAADAQLDDRRRKLEALITQNAYRVGSVTHNGGLVNETSAL